MAQIQIGDERFSIHDSRDWSGLPGYVSMRERPLWMKRSDWDSLCGKNNPGRLNSLLSTRRWAFAYKTRWRDWRWMEKAQL